MQDNLIRGSVPAKAVEMLRLMRPRQWVKNGFVLAPLIFAGKFHEIEALLEAMLALTLFCVASSATYIVNDFRDMESDRQHPIKSKKRPLAAGTVTTKEAWILLCVLYGLLGLGWIVAPQIYQAIVAYLLINLAYSYYLKHQPVVDIFTISLGFVLRVYAGALAIGVPVSHWMFITTLCLSLYLAAVKRRKELSQSGNKGRKVLQKYTVDLVDRYAEISASGALLFYSMFVVSSRPELAITIPLVLFGLFRYWYVVEVNEGGESPTDALLSDVQLMLVIILWAATCVWALRPAA